MNQSSSSLNDCHLSACLSDVPGSPGAPEVKDKTKSSITLGWSPPDKDGGSPIKGYIIELHEEGSPDWKRVNPADKLHPSTEITVPDLKEGKKCKFRIYAVNAAGQSEPAKMADILVQDILSKKDGLSKNLNPVLCQRLNISVVVVRDPARGTVEPL